MTQKIVRQLGHDDIMVEAQALQVLMWHYVPLTTRLTSTDFDGDTFSTTAKTLIDLSVKFGAPDNIRAVDVQVSARDSDSAATRCYIRLGPTNAAGVGKGFDCPPVDNRPGLNSAIVPCDANGDIYYQIVASGANTMTLYIEIWGYFI